MTIGDQLKLYNSLGRRLDVFAPATDTVGVYTCGPTVYAYPHLGDLRAYVFADTLRRALIHRVEHPACRRLPTGHRLRQPDDRVRRGPRTTRLRLHHRLWALL